MKPSKVGAFHAFLFLAIVICSCKKVDNYVLATPTNSSYPIAIAYADSVIFMPNDSVMLRGSASFDLRGEIVDFEWKKVSGPDTFFIASPKAPETVVRKLVIGAYQFELTVTDDQGKTSKAKLRLTVRPIPSKANAGKDTSIVLPSNTVILDGRGSSNPHGRFKAYHWTKIYGPDAYSIGNAEDSVTILTNLVSGLYVFQLTTTDEYGFSSLDAVNINVTGRMKGKIVEYGSDKAVEGAVVIFGYADLDPGNGSTVWTYDTSTTNKEGECWFIASRFQFVSIQKEGYWSSVPGYIQPFTVYYGRNQYHHSANPEGLFCDSFLVKLFPEKEITVHVKDSSRMQDYDLDEEADFVADAIFQNAELQQTQYLDIYFPVHAGIDTIFRINVYGNIENEFKLVFPSFDDIILLKPPTFIPKEGEISLNLFY